MSEKVGEGREGRESRESRRTSGRTFEKVLEKLGELWLWGRNDYGQLGLGEEAMGDMRAPGEPTP